MGIEDGKTRARREYEEMVGLTVGLSLPELLKADEKAVFRQLRDEVQRGDAEVEAKFEKWKASSAQREGMPGLPSHAWELPALQFSTSFVV